MPNYNYVGKFFRNVLSGPERLSNPRSSGSNQFYGRANLVAGTATVSTSNVKADSVISLTIQNASPVGSSGGVQLFGVTSINPGNWFSIGQVTSAANGATASYTAHWLLFNQS